MKKVLWECRKEIIPGEWRRHHQNRGINRKDSQKGHFESEAVRWEYETI